MVIQYPDINKVANGVYGRGKYDELFEKADFNFETFNLMNRSGFYESYILFDKMVFRLYTQHNQWHLEDITNAGARGKEIYSWLVQEYKAPSKKGSGKTFGIQEIFSLYDNNLDLFISDYMTYKHRLIGGQKEFEPLSLRDGIYKVKIYGKKAAQKISPYTYFQPLKKRPKSFDLRKVARMVMNKQAAALTAWEPHLSDSYLKDVLDGIQEDKIDRVHNPYELVSDIWGSRGYHISEGDNVNVLRVSGDRLFEVRIVDKNLQADENTGMGAPEMDDYGDFR